MYDEDNAENYIKGEFEKVKKYRNGSTKEIVFTDINCLVPIGYLNKYEECECYGKVGNRAIVVYQVDGTDNKKVGFVKWLGGIVE